MNEWLKQNEKALKTLLIGLALAVAIVVVGFEVIAQWEFDAFSKSEDRNFEENKPFYDCLLAADAMADENSPEEERLASIEASDECYERYNKR